jgi:SEFIR domain-containing protein
LTKQRPPKVFISYSHDSEEHAARVLRLANDLRRDGIEASIDQYITAPPEGWPRWMDNPTFREEARSESGSTPSCCRRTRLRDMLIGYMRVSKADGSQVLDQQSDALLAASVNSAASTPQTESGTLTAQCSLATNRRPQAAVHPKWPRSSNRKKWTPILGPSA